MVRYIIILILTILLFGCLETQKADKFFTQGNLKSAFDIYYQINSKEGMDKIINKYMKNTAYDSAFLMAEKIKDTLTQKKIEQIVKETESHQNIVNFLLAIKKHDKIKILGDSLLESKNHNNAKHYFIALGDQENHNFCTKTFATGLDNIHQNIKRIHNTKSLNKKIEILQNVNLFFKENELEKDLIESEKLLKQLEFDNLLQNFKRNKISAENFQNELSEKNMVGPIFYLRMGEYYLKKMEKLYGREFNEAAQDFDFVKILTDYSTEQLKNMINSTMPNKFK